MKHLLLALMVWLATVTAGQAEPISELIAKAQAGSPRAQVSLGNAYQFGQGLEKDLSKAFFWYEKAAQQGFAEGQRPLGVLYELGIGTRKDLNKAAFWYEKAAVQGLARAHSPYGRHWRGTGLCPGHPMVYQSRPTG